MGRAERKELISKIEAARGSRVVCYLTSDRPNADAKVSKDVLPLLFDHLRSIGERKQIDVLLFTTGGDTLAAFGFVRLVREFCQERRLGVLVPLRCHSAGTLVAIGANEILMTKGATLSPIDPSISGPLNPAVEIAPGQRQLVPLSVETVAGFKDLVVTDWGLKDEASLSAAFRVLAERVHPMALGDVFRARQQIELLARKLLEHRTDSENVGTIIRTLTRALGSHDYVISRTEARGLFGYQIAQDAPETEDLIWRLYSDFAKEMELQEPFEFGIQVRAARNAGHTGPVKVLHRLAILETTDSRDVAEKEMLLREVQPSPGMPPQVMMAAVQGGMLHQDIVRAGWKHYND
jgi:hypothetical protein